MQLNAEDIRRLLPWDRLIAALNDIFVQDVCAPVRHHHFMDIPGEPEATLLLMPAWIPGKYLGVKQVNVFPGNSARNMPGLTSHYTLSNGLTGESLALLDGNSITALRTAAASALASKYLSRDDTKTLLMVGAGRMGRHLIPAHMSVRDIETIWVWDRHEAASVSLVEELVSQGIDARVCAVDQLENTARQMDMISCATLATEPLIKGDWLKAGAHLDLVGSFTPTMRETDNTAMQKAEVFVDTRAGGLSETGDLIIPIREGAITPEDIHAEFSELCSGDHKGRAGLNNPEQAITLFKSVGDSREDLAAAILAYESNQQG